MLNMVQAKDENGNTECLIKEVVPDESNPQTGLTTTNYRSTGGSPASVRSNKMRRDTSRIKNPSKIFVGGIPGTVNDHEFREFFKQFGTVTDSAVIFDGTTRRSRGFGFVTFKDEALAQKILAGKQVTIRGKICEVKPAEPKVDSNHFNVPKMYPTNYMRHEESIPHTNPYSDMYYVMPHFDPNYQEYLPDPYFPYPAYPPYDPNIMQTYPYYPHPANFHPQPMQPFYQPQGHVNMPTQYSQNIHTTDDLQSTTISDSQDNEEKLPSMPVITTNILDTAS